MIFDLEPDRSELAHQLREGLRNVRPPDEPVTRVDITYDLTSMDQPMVWAELDTEPDGEPGGSRDKVRFMEVEPEQWTKPCHAAFEGETVTVQWAGHTSDVNDEETLCEAVGRFLVEIIKSLREEGVFDDLSSADRCYLGVSTYDGVWGWPIYEDRENDDLV